MEDFKVLSLGRGGHLLGTSQDLFERYSGHVKTYLTVQLSGIGETVCATGSLKQDLGESGTVWGPSLGEDCHSRPGLIPETRGTSLSPR